MESFNPISTYRLQFHKGFTFGDAMKIIPYLKSLGVHTIYASPIMKSVKGSKHGYDVTDPTAIDPEIGSEKAFRQLIGILREHQMHWIQDIVPNHMAFSPENPWIFDLLQKGRASEYYTFFDLNMAGEKDSSEKLMLPFFGSSLEEMIENRELKLTFSSRGFMLNYYQEKYPIGLDSYAMILSGTLHKALPPAFKDSSDRMPLKAESDRLVRTLWDNIGKDPQLKQALNERMGRFNNDQELITKLLAAQHYRPVHWKTTEKEINFRRFFTINGLISLNIQDKKVFNAVHRKVVDFIDQGLIDGLRVDHIDGLYDPGSYLNRLSSAAGKKCYIVVEKILEEDERLSGRWPINGTTGYDFLAGVNNLLTNRSSRSQLKAFHSQWDSEQKNYSSLILSKKRFFLHNRLAGDLENLTLLLMQLPAKIRPKGDKELLKQTIAEFLTHCPVYRIYNAPSTFTKGNRATLKGVFESAKNDQPELKKPLGQLLELFLLLGNPGKKEIAQTDHFYRRCMQYTGPLMAKGIEDTVFYSYNPFIAHNEVGDSPGYFGIAIQEYHDQMIERFQTFPLSMNATSTHDTKRGEDARARLNALSDIPGKWVKAAKHWKELNAPHKASSNDGAAPTKNDEYFIYQSLIGHLPMDGVVDAAFRERFKAFLIKALREAKMNTSWSSPDEQYEEGALSFIDKILDDKGPFLKALKPFMEQLIPMGITNSITQLLLKLTAPGVPDLYQGNEGWNLDMVDPDNRKPVDYSSLAEGLKSLQLLKKRETIQQKAQDWIGKRAPLIKMFVTHRMLEFRKQDPELFGKGSYIPLEVKGTYKAHVYAACRRYRDRYLVTILPLNLAIDQHFDWKSTRVILPETFPEKWQGVVGSSALNADHQIHLSRALEQLPFAVLSAEHQGSRRLSGVLMHISSLPGRYGSGDFGKGAYDFVHLLQKGDQRYWQLLPLSVTARKTEFSPYSAYSAFAGNILYIDPDDLVDRGLLKPGFTDSLEVKNKGVANFSHALKVKEQVIREAFESFRKSDSGELMQAFIDFKKREQFWLEDFALFMCLRNEFPKKGWTAWPESFANRDETALANYTGEHERELEEIRFGQFIFALQWKRLKGYANDHGVDMIGDIPIYMDHDSADVWAHRSLFKLTDKGEMSAVAGVPPDYFNAKGQLWNMPVFDWSTHKAEHYTWWINRLAKNLEWYDLVRLDHFRGFSAYWEVPANRESAIEGKWIKGPGRNLFTAIKKAFPHMPFIAEDLGDIDQEVYALRDAFNLPGMKVLQFGFGENMAKQEHNPLNIPAHSIAYTGTHDNNTVRGWYGTEADKQTKKRLARFTGDKCSQKSIHKSFIRMAFASAANICIVPMQDWLGLDETARMNFPSTTSGNWSWRVDKKLLSEDLSRRMSQAARTFGRY